MSASSKGADRERKAKAILESQGYRVEQAPKVAKYFGGMVRSARHDFWGCIDLIAIHQLLPTLYVQVGRKHDMREKERDVTEFAANIALEHNDVEVWGFVEGRRPEGQRFRVTRWNGAGEWGRCADMQCTTASKRVSSAPQGESERGTPTTSSRPEVVHRTSEGSCKA